MAVMIGIHEPHIVECICCMVLSSVLLLLHYDGRLCSLTVQEEAAAALVLKPTCMACSEFD
jgi:hypothetical protein